MMCVGKPALELWTHDASSFGLGLGDKADNTHAHSKDVFGSRDEQGRDGAVPFIPLFGWGTEGWSGSPGSNILLDLERDRSPKITERTRPARTA